jgi:hypothetical protein
LVRAACEATIVERVGATTEELHHEIIPRLLESGTLREFSHEWGDMTPLLEKTFQFERASGRWFLPVGWLPSARLSRSRLARYFAVRFLAECEETNRTPTDSQVMKHVCDRLDGHGAVRPSTLRALLKQVAYSADGRHWRLAGPHGQQQFAFE